jgi:asparagine synthase (glutamine-hydrolysing)
MSSDDGTVHIVYNGEIYNFKEIRETLIGHGHQFRSLSDTEVILKGYLKWGIECLQEFIGMFSLAIWDSRDQCLYLARDRTFDRDLDPDSLPLFLHYQYVPAPRTVFKDTYKLLPGTYLVYDGQNLNTHTYWTSPESQDRTETLKISEDEKAEELDDLLTGAVADHLISDVPLGALLSGGIDSSLVVALMQKVSTAPVCTFSIGFHEKDYNEAQWAAEVYVTPQEAMEVIPQLPELYDEPFADSSAIPTFLVSRLARSHVTVALSGDGGDEQFSGYVRYWGTQAMAKSFQRFPISFRKTVGAVMGGVPLGWIESCYLFGSRLLPRRFHVVNFRDKWQKLKTNGSDRHCRFIQNNRLSLV